MYYYSGFCMKKSPFPMLLSMVCVLALFLYALGSTSWLLIISFSLAYILLPIVKGLEKLKIPRKWAVFLVSILTVVLFIVGIIFVLPLFFKDWLAFSSIFPTYLSKGSILINDCLSMLGFDVDIDMETLGQYITHYLRMDSFQSFKQISQGGMYLFSNIFHSFVGLVNIVLIPIFFYYLINRFEDFQKECVSWVPKQWNENEKSLEYLNRALQLGVKGPVINRIKELIEGKIKPKND